MYAGGGYAPIVAALKMGEAAVKEILDSHGELVNEVTTGGATPLHMCGMSRQNQLMTKLLIERGANMCACLEGVYKRLSMDECMCECRN